MLDFHNTFAAVDKHAIDHAFEIMRSNASDQRFTVLKALSDKDKFVLFAAGLLTAVRFETINLKARQPISN